MYARGFLIGYFLLGFFTVTVLTGDDVTLAHIGWLALGHVVAWGFYAAGCWQARKDGMFCGYSLKRWRLAPVITFLATAALATALMLRKILS
jgi:hypothetical protein